MMNNNTTGNMNGDRAGHTGSFATLEYDGQHTVLETDGGSLLRMTAAAGPNFVILPANLGVGFFVDVVREGAGSTIAFNATDPEVTIRSRDDRNELTGQWSRARAEVIAPNTWLLSGDLTAGG